MDDAQLKAGKVGKFKVDTGLYFRVTEQKSAFWVLRYTINGKRREINLGRYRKSSEGLPLREAKLKAIQTRASIREGIDPIAEKKEINSLALVPSMMSLKIGSLNANVILASLKSQPEYIANIYLPTLVIWQ